ncbi:PAS domain-containing sensor histidine kinase [Limibacter armeniacum]|uniref:sensor histidine kinase n=1 Tax=Limibacter armeniacum TaxID=466084 RepID=UPI002FE5B96A
MYLLNTLNPLEAFTPSHSTPIEKAGQLETELKPLLDGLHILFHSQEIFQSTTGLLAVLKADGQLIFRQGEALLKDQGTALSATEAFGHIPSLLACISLGLKGEASSCTVTEGRDCYKVCCKPVINAVGDVVWLFLIATEEEMDKTKGMITSSQLNKAVAISRTAIVDIDLSNHRVSMNSEAYKLFEVPRGKVELGTLGSMLLLDDVARLSDYLLKLDEEDCLELHHAICTAKQNRKFVHCRLEAIKGEDGIMEKVFAVFVDETQQVMQQLVVEEMNDKLHQILESISEAFFTVDMEGNIQYINHVAERVFSRMRKDLIGKVIWECFPEMVNTTIYQKLLQVIKTRTGEKFDFYYPEMNKWYDIRISFSRGSITIILNDITHHKMVAESLHEINRSKDRFFSIIAHDLKSPFNSMVGMAEVLDLDEHRMSKEELTSVLRYFLNSTRKMHRLVDNLLNWSKLQMEHERLVYKPVVLYDVATFVLEIYQGTASEKEIQFYNGFEKGKSIVADFDVVETVLRNLVSNALKFTRKGGRIELGVCECFGGDCIYVKDTGVGMSDDIVQKLFKLGEKVSYDGTNGENGTGLGLAICYDLIRKHKGKIWVESREGVGSTFFFSLSEENTENFF